MIFTFSLKKNHNTALEAKKKPHPGECCARRGTGFGRQGRQIEGPVRLIVKNDREKRRWPRGGMQARLMAHAFHPGLSVPGRLFESVQRSLGGVVQLVPGEIGFGFHVAPCVLAGMARRLKLLPDGFAVRLERIELFLILGAGL